MKVALLITTFNRADALELVLRSIYRQTLIPDDVIICDDGSSTQIRTLLKYWQDLLPIRHAWQPNSDFRAARSRNLGVSLTAADYLIWIDGDCLLPPKFVERHLKISKRGSVVAGGRHLLTDSLTESLLIEKQTSDLIFRHWKFRYFPLGFFRSGSPGAWRTVRTCNLGLYREDFLMVCGFDESFVGWGREDSDFVMRLIHNGVKIKSGRLSACVAHLHHCERSRDQLSKNDERFHSCINDPAKVFPKMSIFLES